MPPPAVAEPVNPTAGSVARGAGPSQAWDALLAELPGLIGERVELLQLELRASSRVAALGGGLALAAFITAGTAWLMLSAAISFGLYRAGLSWAWAAAAGVLLNVVLAALAGSAAMRSLAGIGIPATMRQLTAHRNRSS